MLLTTCLSPGLPPLPGRASPRPYTLPAIAQMSSDNFTVTAQLLKPEANPSNNYDQATTQAVYTCRGIHAAGRQCPTAYTFNDTDKQVPDNSTTTFIAVCCVSCAVGIRLIWDCLAVGMQPGFRTSRVQARLPFVFTVTSSTRIQPIMFCYTRCS